MVVSGIMPHVSACSLPTVILPLVTLTLVLFRGLFVLQGLRPCCIHVAGPGDHHA